MRVLFVTAIYRNAMTFLSDCLKSLSQQTYTDFDICIACDDVEHTELDEYIELYALENIEVIDVTNEKSIFMKRWRLIQCGLDGSYDLLIFGDCDDVFSSDRVESVVNGADDEFGIYYNKLIELETGISVFGTILPEYITSVDYVLRRNFLGMTNTAININLVRQYLEEIVPVDILAVDWYIFSNLLLSGARGKRIDGTCTYYRIYDGNIAGAPYDLTVEGLRRGVSIKKQHYSALSHRDNRYKKMLEEVNSIERLFGTEGEMKYINYVNEHSKIRKLWWENIIPVEECI